LVLDFLSEFTAGHGIPGGESIFCMDGEPSPSHQQAQHQQGFDVFEAARGPNRPLDKMVGHPGKNHGQQHRHQTRNAVRLASFNDAQKNQQGPVPQIQREADQPQENSDLV
jgi:hypothetical protein